MSDEETTTASDSFLVLQLDTGTREFRDVDEFEKWIEKEKSFFAWLESANKLDGNSVHAYKHLNRFWSQLQSFVNECRQHASNPSQIESLKQNLINQIETFRNQNQLITSNSAAAQFVSSLSTQEDAAVAAYALTNLLGLETNQSSIRALKGAFSAFRFQQPAEPSEKSHVEALASIFSEWNERFNAQHTELQSTHDEIVNQIQAKREEFESIVESINDTKTAQAEEFQAKVEEAQKTLEDITQTYDQKLALQSSVTYWKEKRAFHTNVMWWMGGATLLIAAASGAVFVYSAFQLLDFTVKDLALSKIGVMLAISTFGIWITRLASKIFISNLHLRTDADERVTMVQTYLALLREGSGPKEEERQLILQTLFRPSTTGFIKDEGPAGVHELLTQIMLKK